jgi:uncharacterized membrane protein YfcA
MAAGKACLDAIARGMADPSKFGVAAEAQACCADPGLAGTWGFRMDLALVAALFAGGVLAGGVSAVAGGASFITFPLLLATGLSPYAAGITNYIALVPANAVALLGYREELARVRRKLPLPLAISAVGGTIGSLLLVWSGASIFAGLVPWLMFAATALFALGSWIKSRLKRRAPLAGRGWEGVSILCQFLLALYGGYFGAGMGFVLLACLNIFGYDDLHEANTVKNAFIVVFSIVGVAILLTSGEMSWLHGLPIAAGTLFGAYGAVRFIRRLPEPTMRYAILAWAALLTAYYFVERG